MRIHLLPIAALGLLASLSACAVPAVSTTPTAPDASASVSTSASPSASPMAGTPAPAASPAVPDPCTLLTDAEVTAAFDSGPKAGTASTVGVERRCDYGDGVRIALTAMTEEQMTATVGALPGIRTVVIDGRSVYIHDPGPALGATTDYYIAAAGLQIELQCTDPQDIGIPAMTELSEALIARL